MAVLPKASVKRPLSAPNTTTKVNCTRVHFSTTISLVLTNYPLLNLSITPALAQQTPWASKAAGKQELQAHPLQ